ncbi:MAG: protein kinase [Blastocatellia bacterium]
MNNPDRLQRIEDLFHAALALAAGERSAFLARACADDDSLRREVESLLEAGAEPTSVIDAPALPDLAQVAAEMISDLPAQPQPSLAGKMIGHYRVLSPLGRGGMGEVWLAADTRLGRRVAIKLLPAEFMRDADLVRRFELEARAASALNHPNIITIHEIGLTGDTRFIATEFIEGETLRYRLAKDAISLGEALDITIQVAAALNAAHDAGIIHRDIKPENIMLRPDGYIKVLDFGLARVTGRLPQPQPADSGSPTEKIIETLPGTVLGTVAYMSPEQARAQKVDGRSDIWSLGVVLYEMLTDAKPFEGQTLPDVFVAILERDPVPLSRYLSNVPPALEAVITRALAKELRDRYATVQEMAADLKALRRQLELADGSDLHLLRAEAKKSAAAVAQQADRADTQHQAAPRTIGLTPEPVTRLHPAPDAPIMPAAPQPESVAASSRKRWPLAGLIITPLIIALIGFAAWKLWPAAPAKIPATPATTAAELPERTMNYSLTVQKFYKGQAEGKQFQATGKEIFGNGWKFRLNLTSPQPGYLYLLNEGPTTGGKIVFNYLFPTPESNHGTAGLAASQQFQTRWYQFDEHTGTENFWLIWSAEPVSELELLSGFVNQQNKGTISDPNQIAQLRALLNRLSSPAPEVTEDKLKKQTTVKARSHTLASLIALEHQ